MSNEVIQEKGRVKSLAISDVKKKLIKNKWRRLCSVDNCDKQSQRDYLCAQHLTENKKRQQTTGNTAVSQQSVSLSLAEKSTTISQNSTNSVFLTGNHTKRKTFDEYGAFLCYINSMYLKASFICHIIFRKYSNNNDTDSFS